MSKTFELDEKVLKGLYRTAGEPEKKFLEDKYGKDFFTKDILDEEDVYVAACAILGLDPAEELAFDNPKNARHEAANAFIMLDIIYEVLQNGEPLNFTPGNKQDKWYPIFNNYSPGSGFRFCVSDYGWTSSNAAGGARLAVFTKALSDRAAVKLIDLWNKFLNPNK